MLPAYAGMIPYENDGKNMYMSAPRVCGDDPYVTACLFTKAKVLPAYAGMILSTLYQAQAHTGAPRVCGDDPTREWSEDELKACSPRMRG